MHFFGNASRKMKIIGVTGTNGKTTTTTLLYNLFRELGFKVGLIGTVVNKIDDESIDATHTTPDPISLNRLLNQMVRKGCKYCFIEVSSHAIDQKRIAGISFAGGVFTNLTHDHLDYHKNFENYFKAKKKFFDSLSKKAFALSNFDDEYGVKILKDTKAKKYFYSLKDKKAGFSEKLSTKLIGEFNAYNTLAIYGTAVLLGEDKEKVKKIIENLDAVPGRFQYIKDKQSGAIGIVDYAHTPDALLNVLKTINDMNLSAQAGGKNKVISVFGCGGDRDKTKRPIMARIGYNMSDIVILTSDNPRSENPEDILKDMASGLPKMDEKVLIIADRKEAIRKACAFAQKGDYILVAGKGHENYQEIKGVKNHFDDIEELRKYLHE